MPTWALVLGTLVLAAGAAMLAMLGLSAGTAFARDYHDLTPRQRVMAKLLGFGALLGAAVFACAALLLAMLALRQWMA